VIQVLPDWQAVEAATQQLENQRLPTHITIQKNWDQWLLQTALADQSKDSWLLDLGCGDCCTLDFLAALGFTKLHGIDLKIKPAQTNLPYQLFEGDLTQTSFPDEFYDAAISISVIEHGVDLTKFFQEAYRLLKPKGLLFVTTDYWEEKIAVEDTIQPFSLAWQIFSKAEIQTLIQIAVKQGFHLQNSNIPACIDKPVSWHHKNYTFVALTFRK
jgi:SAM-dependent methyltransferase